MANTAIEKLYFECMVFIQARVDLMDDFLKMLF